MSKPTPIVPVILSGGFGTRLWPASRKRRPKHLLPLVEERTMFRITLERTRALAGIAAPLVACNDEHRPGVQRELRRAGYDDATILLEPVGRNTAPALAAAAIYLLEARGDAVLLVLPADHLIRDEEAFSRAVSVAVPHAERGSLVTFGIVPTSPATGYGYIRAGDPIGPSARVVSAFVEKPDEATATSYLRSGEYLWNSGMFMFTAGVFLEEMERYCPQLLAACRRAVAGAEDRGGVLRLAEAPFSAAPSISIDYAVMEKTSKAAVVALDAGWSDVGDWDALWRLGDRDADENLVSGEVIAIDVHGSLLRADKRLLGVIGLDDIVVVDAPDALLVARRDRAQDVKILVDRLRDEGRPEFESNGTEWSSWGTSAVLVRDPGVRVRRITVEPGRETSFGGDAPTHWIVVRGRARLSVGEAGRTMGAGEAASVPAGAISRVENTGREILDLIVVDTRENGQSRSK
jgi:mannose-1-phosphate guanylyltransferase/mannose-6-phosphate isomerase